MAYDEFGFQSVVEEALKESDAKLQETQLPEINIGEALPIDGTLDFGVEFVEFGVVDVRGSVKDGIIGNKTTSLLTIDDNVAMYRSKVGQWAKSALWTLQEVEKFQRIGLPLDTTKQKALMANAQATIQYAGYVGHRDVVGQEGLLTSQQIEVITDPSKKTLGDMTSDEAVAMILNAYNVAWAKSGYLVAPTHLAMDAADFMLLMQKFNPTGAIVGVDMLPISAMDRIMAALRKASQNDSFTLQIVKIPSFHAVGLKTGYTRLCFYVYDAEYVEMKVHMPELLPVRQRDLLGYECGYRSAFSGALWKQPASAVYVDYLSTPKAATPTGK